MRELPPLNAIRSFEAAARHLSFNRAAKELYVTPSAVSHQIKVLEEFLGIELFVRHTRRIELSVAGEQYLPMIATALSQIETATKAVKKLNGAEDVELTISVAPSFAAEWLITRLSKFQVNHPDVDVRLITNTQLPDFDAEAVDIAIITGFGDWPNLHSDKLIDIELVPVCSKRYLEKRKPIKQPGDLVEATLIHVSSQMERWPDWLAAAGVEHPKARRGPKLPTAVFALEAAESDLGVALVNRLYVEQHKQGSELVMPLKVKMDTGRGFHLVVPPHKEEKKRVRDFREWLLNEFRA